MAIATLLTDAGNGLGSFLTSISDPLVTFVITLGIGFAIVLLIRKIGTMIGSSVSVQK